MLKARLFSSARRLVRPVKTAGFTMIELLIVISILGILAVAVLSAINPLEQINRGRDTGNRSDAEQLLSAIDRYQAFQGYYPWQTTPTIGTRPLAWTIWDVASKVVDDATTPCAVSVKLSIGSTIPNCVGTDELKGSFFDRIFDTSYNHLYVYNRGTQVGDSTYVCFVPQSKAFIQEADKRCESAFGVGLPEDLSDATVVAEICGGYGTNGSTQVMTCLP